MTVIDIPLLGLVSPIPTYFIIGAIGFFIIKKVVLYIVNAIK